jgi:tRNA-specific 2-thiouridylase
MAAALAVEAGHEVTGVHMALLRNRQIFREGSRGCCSIEDSLDARRVADKLGIPFYVWDLSEEFADLVVADFLAEYSKGRTPNPCIRCNEHVKFEILATRAQALGFDAVATGHYARLIPGNNGVVELHRSNNLPKDQSYVLAAAGPERLHHCYFPLGDFYTKAEVREQAAKRGLAVSNKPDSYDICFIPDGDTRGFLRERLGAKKGPILDVSGVQVGEHDGAYAYTVGQRKGLALGRPAADGLPRYVVSTDPSRNIVVVGGREHLVVTSIKGSDPVWYLDKPPGPHSQDSAGVAVTVQVRAHGREVSARMFATADGAVQFDLVGDMLAGIAAGQSIVAYQGTRVVAQATVGQSG